MLRDASGNPVPDDDVALVAVSPNNRAISAASSTDHAGYFEGGGLSVSRVVNIERTSIPNSNNNLLQLKVPAGSRRSTWRRPSGTGGSRSRAESPARWSRGR